MFYTSAEHQHRFMESMQRLGKLGKRAPDAEYAAALYILTATPALWDKANGYVDSERIEFPALLAEQDFSGGYGVLVTLAGHLFNGRMHLEPLEFLRLDEPNFHVALTALQIRRDSSLILSARQPSRAQRRPGGRPGPNQDEGATLMSAPPAQWFLVVGGETFGWKLRDCRATELLQAEREAEEALKEIRAGGDLTSIVRVVEAESGDVVYATTRREPDRG